MPNRMTFMERMSGRLAAIESVLKKLEPVESLLERITLLEMNEAVRRVTEAAATEPFLNKRRYGKRKKD